MNALEIARLCTITMAALDPPGPWPAARDSPDLQVLKVLGKGSFGSVQLCHDQSTGENVAVKTFATQLAPATQLNNPSWSRWTAAGLPLDLYRELRLLSSLSDCERVVSVRFFGRTAAGRMFLALEAFEGALQPQELPLAQLQGVARALLEALVCGSAAAATGAAAAGAMSCCC